MGAASWLSGQYGLKRLTEHIWMLIGIAKTCTTMTELQEIMAQRFGAKKVQLSLYLRLPTKSIEHTKEEERDGQFTEIPA
jgi:hypothetical protein